MKSIAKSDPHYKIAAKYVREQLAIVDGSAVKGIRRIGTQRFEEIVQKVAAQFIRFRKSKGTYERAE